MTDTDDMVTKMPIRRKIALGTLIVLLIIALLTGYVAIQILGELRAARGILAGTTSGLTEADLAAAVGHLEEVDGSLDGLVAKPLRLVPVVGHNISALDSVVEATIPALHDAQELRARITEAEQAGFTDNGRFEIERLDPLQDPLAQQVESLQDLRGALEEHRSGWLLPPMWDALNTLSSRTAELQRTAERAEVGVDVASSILGSREDRTFLVLYLNNAELRGAGGILSGVGTLELSNGRFELGDFDYYGDLAARAGRSKKVDAPDDLVRRFGRYWADTTLWVNTSASPDVPEVAITARKLYEATTGVQTDGAIILDARGLAAMMPDDATILIPGTDIELARSDLADFVYSGSYRVFDGDSRERRESALALGPLIFDQFLSEDLGPEELERLQDAVSGQHLRVVSFAKEERSALASLGLSGELTSGATDTSLFTVQNLGADKLDHWIDRRVEHGCRLSDHGLARCQSRITLRNDTPQGLPSYVTQDKKPYGLYKGYLEAYVPEEANVTSFTIDDEEPEYFTEFEDARQSLGAYFDTRRNERTRVDLTYDLPFPEDLYTLEVTPQPLTHDASARVVLDAPDGWLIETPDGRMDAPVEYTGPLNRTLRFHATPEERPGLTGIWDRMVNFWNDPLF